MHVLLSLFMAIVPALFLVWYYYKQDREKPEPKGLIVKTFLFGFVIIIPVVIMEIFIKESFSGLKVSFPLGFYFANAFVVAAFSEEILKRSYPLNASDHKK